MTSAIPPKLLRTAKGKKPVYFDDVTDKLLSMVVALVGEVSVLRDRLDTVEQLAARKGVLTSEEVDGYELSDDQHRQRGERRDAYLARVMKSLHDEIARMADAPADAAEMFEGAHALS